VDVASIVATVNPGPTDWLTAIGTVAVAVAAVAVALFAEWRASVRVTAERQHSARILADERAAADKRLRDQQEHSDRQLREERQAAQDAEQLAEAYAVQVVMGERDGGVARDELYGEPTEIASTKILAVMIVNRGNYTITRIEAKFSPDGTGSKIPHRRFSRISGFSELPDTLRSGFSQLTDDNGYGDVLAPGDTGMRFETDLVGVGHIAGPYAFVRWTDRWGQRWEHSQGDVRKISDSAAW
jgi:hypothetical protein